MNSVVVSTPGTFLGKTSERLVVRGPRPRIDAIDDGSQLLLPLDLPVRAPLEVATGDGPHRAELRLGQRRQGNAGRIPDQIELPLFRLSEIVVTAPGVSLSTDLIEACCERGIRVAFLTATGRPVAMLSSPMLTATVQTRREQMLAYGDARGVAVAKAIVHGKLTNQAALLKYFGKYQKAAGAVAFSDLSTAVERIVDLRSQIRKVDAGQIDDARGDLLATEAAPGASARHTNIPDEEGTETTDRGNDHGRLVDVTPTSPMRRGLKRWPQGGINKGGSSSPAT